MSGRFGGLALDAGERFRRGDRIKLRHTSLEGEVLSLEAGGNAKVRLSYNGKEKILPRNLLAHLETAEQRKERRKKSDEKFDDARRSAVRKAK